MRLVFARNARFFTLLMWFIAIPLLSLAVGYAIVFFNQWAVVVGLLALLGGWALVRTQLSVQFLVFLASLTVFTFAVKVGYGALSSTLLALVPSIFLGLLLLQLILVNLEGKNRFHWTGLDLLVIAFFVLDFLQIFNPYLAIFDSMQFLTVGLRGFQQRSFIGLVYFLSRALIRPEKHLGIVARVLAYSLALNAGYGLLQQFFGFTFFESEFRAAELARSDLNLAMYASRAMGFLNSPFTFGMVSAMGMICGLYLVSAAMLRRGEWWIALASVLLNGLGVFLSGSRSTYLAVGLALVVVLGISWRQLIVWVWRARWAILVAVVLFSIVVVGFSSEVVSVGYSIERVSSLTQLRAGTETSIDPNFAVRQVMLVATWPLIVNNPLGYGTGIFNGGSNPIGVVNIRGYSSWVDNEFSSLALEMGVPGVLLLLAIVAWALWQCRQALDRPGLRDRAIVLAALVMICPAAGAGGQWLAAFPANVLFWTFIGITAGLSENTFIPVLSSADAVSASEDQPTTIGESPQNNSVDGKQLLPI